MKLITNLIANTTPKDASSGDPFWQKAEAMYRQSIIMFLCYKEHYVMLSQFEMRLLNELISKKDVFLTFLDSSENQHKYGQAEALYQKVDKAQSDYISSVGNEALSRGAYSAALKDKKIDPFIAGGSAQALGGIAPGVYTAVKASSRNAEIEVRRNTYKTMVFEDSSARKTAENSLKSLLHELDELLNTEKKIKSYRESLLEIDYRAALTLKSNKDYEKAKAAFLSLGNYKDSVSQATSCKSNNSARSIGTVAIFSAFLSIFIVLISGVFTAGIEAAVIVFVIALFINVIVLMIMFLRKTH